MVLNFLYITVLWPRTALCDCFAPSVLSLGFDERACQFQSFLCERNEYGLGKTTGLDVAWDMGMGLFFSRYLFQGLALFPNPPALISVCHCLEMDRKEASLQASASSTKNLLARLGICLSFFLTKAYFACRWSVDHLSAAAVPSLHLPLFLPGEGSFVRKHCTKHAPAVSCTHSCLEQITLKADWGEKL